VRVTDPEGLWDNDSFTVNVTCANDAPVLDWTGEIYYTADGLHPEVGTAATNFAYRVEYSDVEGDAPAFVRVHIQSGGTPISGSPIAMSYVSGNHTDGAIYSYSTSSLGQGVDYTYYFSA